MFGGTAYIAGTFTNWEPRKMLLVDELCAYLQKKDDVLKDKSRRDFNHSVIKTRWRNILKHES